MKLIRFGAPGAEKPGVEEGGKRRDLSSAFDDWTPGFFAGGGLEKLRALDLSEFPEVSGDVRLGAPIARPGKVLGIGLNYKDHAAETGADVPENPIVFFKGPNTVVGPRDDILIPRGSTMTDWEVELAVIIGKEACYLADRKAAADVVAGYAVANDLSERAFQIQRGGGQWGKGKSCDGFCPLGPFMATADEVSDPHTLPLTLTVNGELVQDGNSENLIFDVYDIILDVSQYMTLEPGDLILTGTPAGVGMGMKPPRFLKPGDEVVAAIEGLGEVRQICRAA